MKYTPSALVSEFSGKQGSTVASHNRYGPYFRNRVIPTNPNTVSQQNARNSLRAAAQAWKALTLAQQTAWNTAASLITLIDRLGKTYKPSGFQYFCSVQRFSYVYSGSTAILTAVPSAAAPVPLATMTPAASSGLGTFSLPYTATPLAALTKLVVECTPQLSAGIGFIKPTLFRTILVTAAAAASPANIFAAYVAKFGALAAGKQIGVRCYVLTSDGQRSSYLQTAIIVA